MDKNKAFTLIEVVVSLALFAMVSIMLMSLLNFATSSTTETERTAEAVSNSSATKELLIKTISPSTSIEILNPIAINDLSSYINSFNASGKDDKQYTYLYSIDGVVYYRNPSTDTVGKEIKSIATTDVDLGFAVNSKSTKMLDINMTLSTKEIDPYVTKDTLSIAPLNFSKTENIIDNRVDKTNPSNIIRYISEEIIQETKVSEGPKIISATFENLRIAGEEYDVPFYVSQEPRVVQLYYNSSLVNNAGQIKEDDWILTQPEIDRADYYFKNAVIKQSSLIAQSPTSKSVKFVYEGEKFIDIYGNEYVGTDNLDGTRTIEYTIPTYAPTDQMKFSVVSKTGRYVSYDFKVVHGISQPEIVRFEFLTEDNYQTKNHKYKLPYKLKTYINQNDVYYVKKGSESLINGTNGASRPTMYHEITGVSENEDFYSTIVMPTNQAKLTGDYYPNIGDTADHNGADTRYLNSRVATITFKGTGLIAPDGSRIPVPKSELSKLNGVEEVSVKVTVDKDYTGNTGMLDGEMLPTGYTYSAYIPSGVTTTNWFDPGYTYNNTLGDIAHNGKGVIFTAVKGDVTKRYTYQNEYNTTKPDFHEGTTADSGLSRVWVDAYPDGAWVGGSMRGDVSGDIVVKVPNDEYSSIKDSIELSVSAYGKELVQQPSYMYGSYTVQGAVSPTDKYSYYGLSSDTKKDITLNRYAASPDSSIRYNADYLKHFVLLQDTKGYGPLVRYQVKIEKSYPKGVLEPEVKSVRIYDSTDTTKDKTYIKNQGSFTPNSSMETKYTIGQKVDVRIAFAGSKIRVGQSMDPNLCKEYTNTIATKITDNDVYYEVKLEDNSFEYGKEYYIHLYDYEGVWKEVYKITTKQPKVRSTTVYDLNTEMARSISNPSSTTQPFLPTKNVGQGASYGYQDSNILETPIQLSSIIYRNKYLPVPYVTPGVIAFINAVTGSTFTYAPKNLAQYTLTGSDGKIVNNDWRMFIRSTREDKDYINGGNNINTPSQYNLTNFMTPIVIDKDMGSIFPGFSGGWILNTDDWVGVGKERPNFVPSNVKLDTTGFSVKIFNDRVYSQEIGTTTTPRSAGRPGTVTETNFDIALVDTTTDLFSTETNGVTSGNPVTNSTYTLPHDNSKTPTSIKTNDVLGYGFSLIEQNVDRDPSQNYLGTGTALTARNDREVALMFYVRHFVAGGGADIDLAKIPGTYVKLADLTGFDMTTKSSGGDVLNSQAVNFTVDIQTSFNGNTTIDASNYTSIMKNNYILFTTTELDIEGHPTGKVHFKRYSFADVFGGVRVDDDYNELNLILNHRSRILKNTNGTLNTTPRPVRLSVGYGTNWGLVGISDFKIMR